MHRFASLLTPMLVAPFLATPAALASPEDSPVVAALARVGVQPADLGRCWSPGALATPAALAADPWATPERVDALGSSLGASDIGGTLEVAWAELGVEAAPATTEAATSPLADHLSSRRDHAAARRLDPVVAQVLAESLDLARQAEAARATAPLLADAPPGLLASLAGISIQAATLADSALNRLASPQLEWPDQPTALQTAAGRIWVGSRGADVFEAPFVFVLDPGGDDLYLGDQASPPLSMLVDLAGDDTYRDLPIARAGVALVVDRAGDDSYHGEALAQGAAHAGCGVLLDLEGDDRYDAGPWSQGAARDGVGLLIDVAGDDRRAVRGPGQGVAEGRAFGALLDRSGDDTYYAAGSEAAGTLAQGAGVGRRPGEAGGIGLLVDEAGDDVYQASANAQGYARWHGLGAVLDRAGHDRWIADHRAQGCGLDEAIGILDDRAGDDHYTLGDRGQGHGHDRAVGLLFDRAGRDRYLGGDSAQGVATAGAVAVAVDLEGEDHWYHPPRTGGAPAGERRGEESIALRLDAGGTDVYGGGRTELGGSCTPRGRHALDLDLPTPPLRTLGDSQATPALRETTGDEIDGLLRQAAGPSSRETEAAVTRLAAVGPSLYATLRSFLDTGRPGTVMAVERVLLAMADTDTDWAEALRADLEANLNEGLAAPEAGHLLAWWSTIGEQPRSSTLPLRYLAAPDPRSRRAAAAMLEPLCASDDEAAALVGAMRDDEDALVRAAAARSLAGCGAHADVSALSTALEDAPLAVRDAAGHSLVELARRGLRDEVLTGVRETARGGNLNALEVVAHIPDPGNLTALKVLLAHTDPAVRGRAALAVGAIGSTSAIKALLGREAVEGDPYVSWCLDRALRTPGNPPAIALDPR
jgi:HEAT repeat protein